MRAVVTGGAGFLGSHLVESLLAEDWEVLVVDTMAAGSSRNLLEAELAAGASGKQLTLLRDDAANLGGWAGRADYVIHMASLASPRDYRRSPIETLRAGSVAAEAALSLARKTGAQFMTTSTSEVYGDPLVSPQPETYWGNVNPVGERSCYDEAKRFTEALAMAYHREYGLDVKLPRIFNTYGPRMRSDDGRLVPTLIRQALAGQPMTIEGSGEQTRSLCYVSDMIDGLRAVMHSDIIGPVNVGSMNEVTVREVARLVCDVAEEGCYGVEPLPAAADDPQQRCPDTALIRERTGWEPRVGLRAGLGRTIAWARQAWKEETA